VFRLGEALPPILLYLILQGVDSAAPAQPPPRLRQRQYDLLDDAQAALDARSR
jgi:hypothetical protein